MHEMKEKLIKAGTDILNASKTELYVSMRFLDIALNSLGYEMDLSMKTIGTDSQKIRFNPRYLIENYQNDSVLVNRAYLHMLLHCVFRHMFHNCDKDEDVWNLSCDIAVTAIIDQMNYRCIRLVVPDERQAMYDRLKSEMKVLTAEGIYKSRRRDSLWWTIMFSGIRSRRTRRMATAGMTRIRTMRIIRMMRTMTRMIRTITGRRNRKSRSVRSRRNSGRRSVRRCARIWRPVLKTRLRWLETFMTILK